MTKLILQDIIFAIGGIMKTKKFMVDKHNNLKEVDKYVKKLTEADALAIAESVFGTVEELSLSGLKNGTKILQFEVNGTLCRYEIRDFGLKPLSPRQLWHMGRACALNLSEMYRAYINFMKTAKYENGELRFPNFENDLNTVTNFPGFNLLG